MVRYMLVTGGVISGIGKGIIASSAGLLLKSLGLRVTAIKARSLSSLTLVALTFVVLTQIDPYLNIDAGLMNPHEHGEVFVLDDGGEVDLDLGNYERFLDATLTFNNNITTGKIYNNIIMKERRGDYLGRTVQVIPHVTDAIMDWIDKVSRVPVDGSEDEPDVCIIELGGTIGDIESAPFVEAMRQFQFRVGHENFCLAHVSLVPIVGGGEQKSKPTQASVRDLRGLGLSPDFIMCRGQAEIEDYVRSKIAMFCHVDASNVVGVHDCKSIYHVPLLLEQQGFLASIVKRLKLDTELLPSRKASSLLVKWRMVAERNERAIDVVHITIVGKYVSLIDSYMSIIKSLEHAALYCNCKLQITWIESEHLEEGFKERNPGKYHDAMRTLVSSHGIIVPGGFGERGFEGKVVACKWAREKKIPYLGICLGLQVAVVEFARNLLGYEDAHTTEIRPQTARPLVINMPEVSTTHLGGTMRLGSRVTVFVKDGVMKTLYGADKVSERHRHRYEVNTQYLPELEAKGLHFVGHDEKAERMEILELEGHPYFVATQFHPEYKTRPLRPSPPFLGLVLATTKKLQAFLLDRSVAGYKAEHAPSAVVNGVAE